MSRVSGVAGVVKVSVIALHDKPARIAAVGAVRQAAGVNGVDEFDPAKIKLTTAAVIDRMRFWRALLAQPLRDFKRGDNRDAGPFGDGRGVSQVILMSVRDENVVRLKVLHVNGLGQRIAGDKRVEEQCLVLDLHCKTSVSVICKVHGFDAFLNIIMCWRGRVSMV